MSSKNCTRLLRDLKGVQNSTQKDSRDIFEYLTRCYTSFAKDSCYILTITKLLMLKLTRKVSPVVRNTYLLLWAWLFKIPIKLTPD